MNDFEKLINASDLIEWIMETYPDWCVGAVRSIVDHVEALPSAQPEIIRCKDCKWWRLSDYNTVGIHVCKKFGGVRGESDFCSRPERRTE